MDMSFKDIPRCGVMILWMSALAMAEDAADSGAALPKPSALGVRQQRVERMMEDVERKFKSLAQTLQESEPQRAERLVKTLQQAKQMLIQQRMGQIAKLLDESRLDSATGEQRQILADVQALIELLLEDDERNKRLEEYERLRQWKEQIGRLLDEELPQQRESDKLANKDKTLADLAARIKAIEELIKKQEQIIRDTEQTRGEGIQGLGRVADSQRAVRQETEKVAEGIAKSAGQSAGEGGAQGDTPAESPRASQPSEPGQRPLGQAAGNQKSAEDNLQDGKGKAAQQDEERALADLKRALEELQNENRRIASLPPEAFDELAKRQDETADKTARLDEQMQKAPQSGDGGGDAKSPGQKQVQQARQSMQRASGGLKQLDPAGASRHQDEAIRQLEKALQEIEERLAQLREETQVEKLARLEARFREMLARQQVVTLDTAALDKKKQAGGLLLRADRLALGKQVAEEQALSEQAYQALEIIIADGTSVVFPNVVEQLRADLTRVGELLATDRIDGYTQLMQREVEATLQELIEALQKAQQQKKPGESSSAGGGQSEPSLLPSSAELKLLRAAQLRVNRRTAAFDQTRPAGALDDVLKREIENIAARQSEIGVMTLRILERN
jgi:hypothetical protein